MILVVLVLRSSNSGSSGSTSSTTISSITTWGPYHGGGAVDTQHETIYMCIFLYVLLTVYENSIGTSKFSDFFCGRGCINSLY